MSSDNMSILVGVDFSESSDRALIQARDLAERLSARLDILYVYDISVSVLPELIIPSNSDVTRMAEDRQRLKELRAQFVGNSVPSRVHLRVGDPVTGLLAMAEETRPALIVVGSHGRGAMMRALLGSVSERLCRRSPVPVLVVPAPGRAQAAAELHPAEKATPPPPGPAIAWSCDRCGHIRGRTEAADRCARCGLEPAVWNSAPMSNKPADEAEPAIGERLEQGELDERGVDPGGLFATSPPGTSGYSVNPELRVRY